MKQKQSEGIKEINKIKKTAKRFKEHLFSVTQYI